MAIATQLATTPSAITTMGIAFPVVSAPLGVRLPCWPTTAAMKLAITLPVILTTNSALVSPPVLLNATVG